MFNSQDWISNRFGVQKPQDSFYYPGFNVGGPIPKTRDKLFFFFGSVWMRQNVAVTVPTAAMRQGDFGNTAYIQSLNGFDVNTQPLNDAESGGGNNWGGPPLTGDMLSGGVINPKSFDPGGKILLNLYPLPNIDPAQNHGFNYVSSIVNPQHRNQQRARVYRLEFGHLVLI